MAQRVIRRSKVGSGQAPAIDESKCFIIFQLREGMGIRVAVVLLSPANPRSQTEPPRAREAMPPHEATRAADLTSRPGTTSIRSEEHTSNSSHVSISYAVFCLKKKTHIASF